MSRTIATSLAALCSPLLCVATPGAAQAKPVTLQSALGNPDNFKISGSVRLRYESLEEQARTGLNLSDELLAIRTTVSVEYRDGPIRIGAEVFDSRAYLAQAGSSVSTNDVNVLEPVQAYVAADFPDAFGKGSRATVQMGRFMLNLGSRRLISADDYRNTTSGSTGIRADFVTPSGLNITGFYVLPQIRFPDDQPSLLKNKSALDSESFDLRLWGALVTRPRAIGAAAAELGYTRLQEEDAPFRPNRNRDLHTINARVIRDAKMGKVDYEAEAIWQFGHVRASSAATAALLDVNAWMFHLGVGYSFPGAAKARLSLAYDYASGDGPSAKYGRFDTLYGMRRAEYGPSGIYSAIGRANISSPAVRLDLAPGKRLDVLGIYRPMWLAGRTDSFATTGVRDATGKSGNFAGHQFDGRVRYWLLPGQLRGEVNAVYLAKGRFLRQAPNAPRTGDTRYIAVSLTASF